MKINKIVLALSATVLLSNVAFGDDAEAIAELKREMAALQANQEALIDETSNTQVGFTSVESDFSHNGMGAAASKVYMSKSPLSIGGYGEMYFASPDNGDNFADVYRFVPYFGYKFNDNIILNTELEFEHGGANGNGEGYVVVEFMYLDFLIDEAFNIQVGNFLTPVGLINLRHEPVLFNTVQRPNTEKYLIPSTWNTNGVMTYGNIAETGLSYNAGLVQALDLDNSDAAKKKQIRSARAGTIGKSTYNRVGVVGRLDYRGISGLLVGGSLYYGDAAQGSVADAAMFMYDFHAVYEISGFKAKAVYTATKVYNADKIAAANATDINTPDGASISDANGYFINLEYDILASLSTTYKLPIFAQYDYIDPTATVVDQNNDEITALDPSAKSATTTFGINFFPHEQVVLKLDYAMTNYDDATAEDYNTISASFGFIF